MCTVNSILLVDVEPVGGPEHGKEEDDPGFVPDRFVKAVDLREPSWVLLQDDAGTIFTNDILGIGNRASTHSTKSHKDDKGNVSSICDCAIGVDVDVLTEGNLVRVRLCNHTVNEDGDLCRPEKKRPGPDNMTARKKVNPKTYQ